MFKAPIDIHPQDATHCGDCRYAQRGAMDPDVCLLFDEELELNLGDLVRGSLCVAAEKAYAQDQPEDKVKALEAENARLASALKKADSILAQAAEARRLFLKEDGERDLNAWEAALNATSAYDLAKKPSICPHWEDLSCICKLNKQSCSDGVKSSQCPKEAIYARAL